MDPAAFFIVYLQCHIIILWFYHQIKLLGVKITFHRIAPFYISDLQQFRKKIDLRGDTPSGKFLFHFIL